MAKVMSKVWHTRKMSRKIVPKPRTIKGISILALAASIYFWLSLAMIRLKYYYTPGVSYSFRIKAFIFFYFALLLIVLIWFLFWASHRLLDGYYRQYVKHYLRVALLIFIVLLCLGYGLFRLAEGAGLLFFSLLGLVLISSLCLWLVYRAYKEAVYLFNSRIDLYNKEGCKYEAQGDEVYAAGRKGEEAVAKELAELSDDYFIWNDVSFKERNHYANIDHLVIGPTGVFLLETKAYAGKVTCDENGKWTKVKVTKSRIYESDSEPAHAMVQLMNYTHSLTRIIHKNKMHVNVFSVIVSTTEPWDVKKKDVKKYVCHIRELKKLIKSKPRRLSRNTVLRINDIMAKERLRRGAAGRLMNLLKEKKPRAIHQ